MLYVDLHNYFSLFPLSPPSPFLLLSLPFSPFLSSLSPSLLPLSLDKKTPHKNLERFQIGNEVPMMEGEGSPSPPLYRTGSDTDIATVLSHTRYPNMLQDVPVGPHLRLAKSSSLESLQTVMHYTINADVAGGPLR